MGEPFDWDKVFDETAKANAEVFDSYQTPEKIAEAEACKKAEFDKGVSLGWWDENGVLLPTFDEVEEDDGED